MQYTIEEKYSFFFLKKQIRFRSSKLVALQEWPLSNGLPMILDRVYKTSTNNMFW